MSFDGFTPDALRFLFENKLNNSKEWYESHKDEYKKYVYEPLVELVKELAPVMEKIDNQIITIPSKIISRVRRDTRFTKDKSLYRDKAWIVFLRDKSKMSISPCFWFELNQDGTSHGVGYYSAEPQTMDKMREMIMDRHPAFLKALSCYETQDEFVMGGEMYKKSRFPEQPEKLKKDFIMLKPIYDFLCMLD